MSGGPPEGISEREKAVRALAQDDRDQKLVESVKSIAESLMMIEKHLSQIAHNLGELRFNR